MSIDLNQPGSSGGIPVGEAFRSIGEQQAQALQPGTLDEAFLQNAIKQGAFQFFLFFASIAALTATVFTRRTFGERSFGMRAFIAFIAVCTIGFGAARDPENAYALSWFGPLFVLLWIGFYLYHRVQMFVRKVKRAPYVYSRTDGNPWLPWALIPRVRKWADSVGGYSMITMYLDPIMVFLAALFAFQFIGGTFGLMLTAGAFSIFTTQQMKNYFEREKMLDTMDAQIEARVHLMHQQAMDGAAEQVTTDMQGFVVMQTTPPKLPGFLAKLPAFANMSRQPLDDMVASTPPPPATVSTPAEPAPDLEVFFDSRPEELARRAAQAASPAPPPAAAGMISGLDPALQNLVEGDSGNTPHVVEEVSEDA